MSVLLINWCKLKERSCFFQPETKPNSNSALSQPNFDNTWKPGLCYEHDVFSKTHQFCTNTYELSNPPHYEKGKVLVKTYEKIKNKIREEQK